MLLRAGALTVMTGGDVSTVAAGVAVAVAEAQMDVAAVQTV